MEVLGERRPIVVEDLLHSVDDIQRGSAPGFVDTHEDTASAVSADDIGLRRKTISDVGDLPHIDGCAVHGFDGEIVQALNGERAAIQLDGIFEGA